MKDHLAMSSVTIADLQKRKEELIKLSEYVQSHEALLKNRHFNKVILEGFLVYDCARYAQESADPLLTEGQRNDAMNMAQAAGHLKRYLQIQLQMATRAASDIMAIDESIAEIRAEGGV